MKLEEAAHRQRHACEQLTQFSEHHGTGHGLAEHGSSEDQEFDGHNIIRRVVMGKRVVRSLASDPATGSVGRLPSRRGFLIREGAGCLRESHLVSAPSGLCLGGAWCSPCGLLSYRSSNDERLLVGSPVLEIQQTFANKGNLSTFGLKHKCAEGDVFGGSRCLWLLKTLGTSRAT